MTISAWLGTLADLVVPVACVGCGVMGAVLCARCRGCLARPRLVTPAPRPQGLPPVVACAAYDGPVRAALVTHKERGILGLARPLGTALSRAVAVLVGGGAGHVTLVPVPSTRAAVRRRGHDPTLRIARVAAAALAPAQAAGAGHVRVLRGLAHSRHVADQSELDAAGRAANLSGALVARPSAIAALEGRPVVVVDDLMTTGATLAEAARALVVGGAEVLGAAVVAATERAREGAP